MLRFTIRMMLADLNRVFRGYWMLLYLSLLCLVIVLPFCSDNIYSLSYLIMIVLSYLAPQMPKLLHVLPLGVRAIRHYLHLRSLLLLVLFLSIGGIMTYLSSIWPVPYLKQGWLILLFYSQVCLLMGLIHINAEKRRTYPVIAACIVLLIGNLINSLFSTNFMLHLRISIGFLLASELLLLLGLQSVRPENYTDRFIGYHQLFKNRAKAGGQTS